MWSTATVVYELATKKPLFCGDSETDQLYRIFAVLGTPDKTKWPGVEQLNDYNESFPTWQRKGIAKRMREHSPNHQMTQSGIDLLEEMLIYDPRHSFSVVVKSFCNFVTFFFETLLSQKMHFKSSDAARILQ